MGRGVQWAKHFQACRGSESGEASIVVPPAAQRVRTMGGEAGSDVRLPLAADCRLTAGSQIRDNRALP